jgi:hypothetical protein
MQDNTTVQELERKWETSRWQGMSCLTMTNVSLFHFSGCLNSKLCEGVKRPYTAKDVIRLRRSLKIEYTLARVGSEKLWHLLKTEPYVATFGAMTGSQAVQMVKGGLKVCHFDSEHQLSEQNITYTSQQCNCLVFLFRQFI